MKYKVETDDKLEAEVLVKSQDYYLALWDIEQNIRSKIKYDEEASQEVIKERERIQKEFYGVLESYNIKLDLLP